MFHDRFPVLQGRVIDIRRQREKESGVAPGMLVNAELQYIQYNNVVPASLLFVIAWFWS